METPLQKIKENGLKCNTERLFFGQTEMEYIGFWVTWDRIRPINKKVESIINMLPPTNRKQVQAFIVVVNYYIDTWAVQSHWLHPLTALASSKVKLKWTEVEKNRLMISKVLSPTTPYYRTWILIYFLYPYWCQQLPASGSD